MQQEPSPRVREDKYRPLKVAEAGLYTGEDKGGLCALVHVQLVCAQHADAARAGVLQIDMVPSHFLNFPFLEFEPVTPVLYAHA
ncbi:hypothetical protein IEO21_10579 [Rhodonia placenta]|uniref:Uncharacterized protein n=1 Tax=Rhodonia placenta TaxID=104341 RepID=A0A8H7NS93_9APHY|nr:hypothetical protein IEO21_10579 [Postia placenta]